MNTAVSTTGSGYLERVAAGLADLAPEDLEEVIADLRAHLAEIDEPDIEATLGSPEEFVAEFRFSAGLGEKRRRRSRRRLQPMRSRIDTMRSRIDRLGKRLAEITHWPAIRPVWIWTRGWLLVSLYAVFSGGTAFRKFPIPVVDDQTSVGFALVVLATAVSTWLDHEDTQPRRAASAVYNAVTVILLLSSMVSVVDLSRSSHFAVEEVVYPDQLMGPEGNAIENIYAYDVEGNPVEVLLFDQDGRPLLSLPSWVYEESEYNQGVAGPFEYGDGAVEFRTDEFGRAIPNLYPLDLYRYGEYGLAQIPPPALGFPGTADAIEGDESVPSTTTMPTTEKVD